MKAELSQSIEVERITLFAEMAWMERRPELGLLCRAARERARRLSPELIQEQLPGLELHGAWNIIRWCATLGLCDGRGGLKPLADDVAEQDEAPVPEQGVYALWVAAHPVLGRRVLAAQRVSTSRGQRFEQIVDLPSSSPDVGVTFRSVVDPKERFMIRALPSNHDKRGCIRGKTSARCTLHWILDFDEEHDAWRLEGAIDLPDQRPRAIQHAPESESLDLWALVDAWADALERFGTWIPQARYLAVRLDPLSEQEQEDFSTSLTLPRLTITGKGSYENARLHDVPIGPRSPADAQRWAMQRLVRHLTREPSYRARGSVCELFASLVEDTKLELFSPRLPAHHELIERPELSREVFWSLAAGVDLTPSPPSEEELAALELGARSRPQAVTSMTTLRLPHRARWSMRRFVDQLLGGAAPRRVLLCDRYVRGEGNLESLALLVAAFRQINDALALEVWTKRDGADFKRLESITGARPLGYADTFGGGAPHDRYILVRARRGEDFAWQLSNSPLHARAIDSSISPVSELRWRDCTGTRLRPEQLDPRLASWFTGGHHV